LSGYGDGEFPKAVILNDRKHSATYPEAIVLQPEGGIFDAILGKAEKWGLKMICNGGERRIRQKLP